MNILDRIQPQMDQNKANTLLEMSRKAKTLLSQKNEKDKLWQVTKDFESLFVKQMLDAMRKTVTRSSLVPENSGEKYFRDMLYGKYAKKISETTNLGLADMLYKELDQGQRIVQSRTPSLSVKSHVSKNSSNTPSPS